MNEINASIITIGDELLIGQTIDTNSAFIAAELNKIGIWVKRRVAVGDVKEEIFQSLQQESKQSDLIIITGGLGPTADDITKPVLCDYFSSKLITDEGVLQNIRDIFEKIKNNIPNAHLLLERNLKQAEVPHNCTVLPNLTGTAPGMWFEKDNVVYVSMPGVPNEMMGLMQNSVLNKLKEKFTLPAIIHRTLFTAGQGESIIADMLTDFEKKLPVHIKLAYLPNYGMVKLRLTGKGNDAEKLTEELNPLFSEMNEALKELVVADEDITLQEAIAKLCEKYKLFIGSAESCTGGYIAHLFTAKPGSSSSYKGGIVSYANQAKENILHVQHATLVKHGAVSEETITEMVKGALDVLKADYAVATSGILGPDGGTPQKPVGTVWIAAGNQNRIVTAQIFLRFDRRRNIEIAASNALNLLRKLIIEEEGE